VNCGPQSILLYCYYRLPFTRFIYILANYYILSLDTLNPLFTVNLRDWQPHCKLGQSTWLCCVQVPHCCWCKATPWTSHLAPLSGAVAKLAGINLRKFGSFSYWFDKPLFHNWGKTCCYAHHNLRLGFPTGRLYIYNSYINTAPPTSFLAPLPEIEEEEKAPTSTTRQQNITPQLKHCMNHSIWRLSLQLGRTNCTTYQNVLQSVFHAAICTPDKVMFSLHIFCPSIKDVLSRNLLYFLVSEHT
jgi:hypothetical protein